MALGSHHGSFAKGFTDGLLAVLKLYFTQQHWAAMERYYNARADYYEGKAGGKDPERERVQREGEAGYRGDSGGTYSEPSGNEAARAPEYMDYLQKQGYTKEGAAAILGNWWQENRLRGGGYGGDGGTSAGGFQWHDDPAKGLHRGADFMAWAKSNGLDVNDPMTSLKYLVHDLGTNYKDLDKQLRSTNDVQGATQAFTTTYEGPKPEKANMPNRVGFAQRMVGQGEKPTKTAEGDQQVAPKGDKVKPAKTAEKAPEKAPEATTTTVPKATDASAGPQAALDQPYKVAGLRDEPPPDYDQAARLRAHQAGAEPAGTDFVRPAPTDWAAIPPGPTTRIDPATGRVLREPMDRNVDPATAQEQAGQAALPEITERPGQGFARPEPPADVYPPSSSFPTGLTGAPRQRGDVGAYPESTTYPNVPPPSSPRPPPAHPVSRTPLYAYPAPGSSDNYYGRPNTPSVVTSNVSARETPYGARRRPAYRAEAPAHAARTPAPAKSAIPEQPGGMGPGQYQPTTGTATAPRWQALDYNDPRVYKGPGNLWGPNPPLSERQKLAQRETTAGAPGDLPGHGPDPSTYSVSASGAVSPDFPDDQTAAAPQPKSTNRVAPDSKPEDKPQPKKDEPIPQPANREVAEADDADEAMLAQEEMTTMSGMGMGARRGGVVQRYAVGGPAIPARPTMRFQTGGGTQSTGAYSYAAYPQGYSPIPQPGQAFAAPYASPSDMSQVSANAIAGATYRNYLSRFNPQPVYGPNPSGRGPNVQIGTVQPNPDAGYYAQPAAPAQAPASAAPAATPAPTTTPTDTSGSGVKPVATAVNPPGSADTGGTDPNLNRSDTTTTKTTTGAFKLPDLAAPTSSWDTLGDAGLTNYDPSRTQNTAGVTYNVDDSNTTMLSRRGGPIGYDDGGGVSGSAVGMPPGLMGQQQIPPIYFNPATYSAAGAPVGKGITSTSAPVYTGAAIPTLPMLRGGVVRRFADGGPADDMGGDTGYEEMQIMNDADEPGPQAATYPYGGGGAQAAPPPPQEHPSARPDPNLPSIMPQISDADGNPSRSITDAIAGGLHYIAQQLGLVPGQAQAGQIANDPQIAANRRQFFTGQGVPGAPEFTQEHKRQLDALVDPGGSLDNAEKSLAGLEAVRNLYLQRGDIVNADKTAASMLQASVTASQKFGDEAVKRFYHNDLGGAIAALNEAKAQITDGTLVNARIVDDPNAPGGQSIEVSGRKLNGEELWRQTVGPQAILAAAMHARDGSYAWGLLEGAAGRYNPTYAEHVKARQQVAKEQAQQEDDRRAAQAIAGMEPKSRPYEAPVATDSKPAAPEAPPPPPQQTSPAQVASTTEQVAGATRAPANTTVQPPPGSVGDSRGTAQRASPPPGVDSAYKPSDLGGAPGAPPPPAIPERPGPPPAPVQVASAGAPPATVFDPQTKPATESDYDATEREELTREQEAMRGRSAAEEKAAYDRYYNDQTGEYKSGGRWWSPLGPPSDDIRTGKAGTAAAQHYAQLRAAEQARRAQTDAEFKAEIAAMREDRNREHGDWSKQREHFWTTQRQELTAGRQHARDVERDVAAEKGRQDTEKLHEHLNEVNQQFDANLKGRGPKSPQEMNSLMGEGKMFDPYAHLAHAFNPDAGLALDGSPADRVKAANELKAQGLDANTQTTLANALHNGVRWTHDMPEAVGPAIRSFLNGNEFTAQATATDPRTGAPIPEHGEVTYSVSVVDNSGNTLSMRIPAADLRNLKNLRQQRETAALGKEVAAGGYRTRLGIPARPEPDQPTFPPPPPSEDVRFGVGGPE